MRGDNNLKLPRRSERIGFLLGRVFSLFLQKAEHGSLKLRVQMGFGFFDQKKG